MSLKQTIQNDMKEALRQRNDGKLSVLRMLLAAISNKEIELGKKEAGLSDQEILAVIQSDAKKRIDAIEQFTKGQRVDLAQFEAQELKILKLYLPDELSDEELEEIVKASIKKAQGARDKLQTKDFGMIMKGVMPVVGGRASGDRVSALVRKLLA